MVSHELAAYLSCFNLFLTQWTIAILSKGCKPDNFESHNSHTLTNIRGLCSNLVECESFLESNFPDIVAWFWQFLCDGLSSFTPKELCYSYAWSCSLCKGRTGQDLYLENSTDSYFCFRLALLHSVFYFFFLYQSPSSSLCTVFDSVSSNIVEVVSIDPSANMFVFGDFDVDHKEWWWLTFQLRSLTVTLTVVLFWIYLLMMLVFVLEMLSFHWEILIMLLSQFRLTFHQNQIGMPCFII